VIIVGRTYLIPKASASASVMPAPSAPALAPVAIQNAAPAVPSQPEYIYTVKEGDSLWRIASEQLGSPSTMAAIKEMNKDVLRGGDVVQPNMKLRLPAKPLASAE
jgi:nucleoid-associated protein YgaU